MAVGRELHIIMLFWITVFYVKAQCPSADWALLDGRCFYVATTVVSGQAEAVEVCKNLHDSTLASLNVLESSERITTIVKERGQDLQYWIGLYKNEAARSSCDNTQTPSCRREGWVWLNGEPYDVSTARWATSNGEPSGQYNENCARMKSDGTWWDINCAHKDEEFSYICMKELPQTTQTTTSTSTTRTTPIATSTAAPTTTTTSTTTTTAVTSKTPATTAKPSTLTSASTKPLVTPSTTSSSTTTITSKSLSTAHSSTSSPTTTSSATMTTSGTASPTQRSTSHSTPNPVSATLSTSYFTPGSVSPASDTVRISISPYSGVIVVAIALSMAILITVISMKKYACSSCDRDYADVKSAA